MHGLLDALVRARCALSRRATGLRTGPRRRPHTLWCDFTGAVADDAVVDREAVRSSHSVFGVTPMPTTTTSASIREPSESATPATRDCRGRRSRQPRCEGPRRGPGAWPRPCRRTSAQGWGKRDRKRLDHGDWQAASAAGGGDLEADEPCAHDRDTGRVHQCPTQHDRVVQTA